MFRHSVLTVVLCMLMLGAVYTTDAQAEPFTWEPYDFTITPPDEWEVQTTASELILSEFSAEDSPFISVVVVPPKSLPTDVDADLLEQYSPSHRSTSRDAQYGENTWPTIDEDLVFGGRQIGMALVAETFIVSWSAPLDSWDNLEPLFVETIASITASPIVFAIEDTLTQRLSWRGLSFDAPEDWIFAWAGQDNHVLVTSQQSRVYFGATFRYGPLTLDVLDVSAVRLHLTPNSLRDFSLFATQPGMFDATAIETEIVGDFSISSAPISQDGQEYGRALLMVAPDAAFVVVGVAGEAEWAATERALFEAILGTLTIE